MRVHDAAALNTRLANLLDDETITKGGRSEKEVRIAIPGAQEAVLWRGTDEVWRLIYWSTFGELELVSGQGCDRTGFVVSAEVAHRLEVLSAR